MNNSNNKVLVAGVAVVAVVVLLALFAKKEHFDNPLVFLAVITVFVTAGQKIGQWAGVKANAPGVASFFGATS